MPYNPSSAYPRHTTYTPPVYGRGYARGFNEQEPGSFRPHPLPMPTVDVRHALQAALMQPDRQMIAEALQAQGRKGLVSMGLEAVDKRAQEKRKTMQARKDWNRAEYGDDPNELGPAPGGGLPTGPPSGPPLAAGARVPIKESFDWPRSNARGGRDPLLDSGPLVPGQVLGGPDPFGPSPPASDTGGRAHVAPVNDRLGEIVQRVTTSSAMNTAVNSVLSGKVGGPMTVPKLVFGAARAANRRRK